MCYDNEDELEIEANKAIDLKLMQDKAEEVEAETHDYLVDEDRIKKDFED